MAEPMSEQEIIQTFSDKRSRLNNTWGKMTELAAETTEHELVIKTLEGMDHSRTCFRLVGEVLVQRTIAEVLPALQKNKDNLESTISNMEKAIEAQRKDLAEYQAKYKIKVTSGNDEDDEGEEPVKPTSQGVLVK